MEGKELILAQKTAVYGIKLYLQGFQIGKRLPAFLQRNGPQGFIIVGDPQGGRIGQGIVKCNG